MYTTINFTKYRPQRFLVAVAISIWAITFFARGQTLYYWYNIGPQPIIISPDFNTILFAAGRVPALAVDPSNSNHWLIGAAQGGIWESTNAGTFWPRTDDQPSLAMGAIAFAPGNPSIVYAGTGEANFRGDAYAGAGLLISQDGGTDWQMLNTNFAKTSFSRILVDPSNSGNLAVATTRGGAGVGEESAGHNLLTGAPARGVYVSTNGGTDFNLVLTGEATALADNPNNFNQQYAGLGEIYGDPTNGVYRTTDGWQTSEPIHGPWTTTNFTYTNFPIATNYVVTCSNMMCYTNPVVTYTNLITGTNFIAGGRIAIAISPSNPNTLYVGVSDPRSRYVSSLRGIWVTTDAWDANPIWTQLPSPLKLATNGVNLPRFWYFFDLLVDPADPTVLYLAEFDVWRYSTGTWINLTDKSNNSHPDNHIMAWVHTGGSSYKMLLGNDGGVYLSDAGVTGNWTTLNSTLDITQFYKGAVDPTGQNVLALGGTQDNGTSLYIGSTPWTSVFGGDGGDCAISAADPLNDWALSSSTIGDSDVTGNTVNISYTLDGGFNSHFNPAAGNINDGLPGSRQFYVHFEKAPYYDNLVIAGTARLWRCDNFFSLTPGWTPNSPTMLDTNGAPVPISAMAFAPSDATGHIYAYGTQDGQLRITTDGGDWQDLDPANGVPDRYVSGLAFSPDDPNILYATVSGFDEDTPGQSGHLFKTTNALAATPVWTDVSPPVDLPNDCLAIDPANANNIFVGTDIGVWQSPDGGGSWSHYGPGDGMPNVAVYDLHFDRSSHLTAFTHGRGAFQFHEFNIPVVKGVVQNPHAIYGCLTCPPDQPWLNPGDEVSIDIGLESVLPIDTVDLTATLLPSAGITPITATQDYGVLKGQGPSVARTFSFLATGAGGPGAPGRAGPSGGGSGTVCGDTLLVVLQLQDQGMDLGHVTIPYRLGMPSHPLIEDFEEEPPPALSPLWATTATGAAALWSTTTNPPTSQMETGEDEFPSPPSTNTAAFVPDSPGVGESFLTSPPFTVTTPQAQLYFRESLALSNSVDGGILEIAIGGSGNFQEITSAGGSFVKDGYNATLVPGNPLGAAAWSGDTGGWVPVIVNLPPTAAGQNVQLRWHFAGSSGMPDGGWYVDSVLVTEPVCLPPVVNPVITNPSLTGNLFTFTIDTVSNRNYDIQWKTNLTDPTWQTMETLPGNGSQQVVSVPINPDKQRFYRFVVQ
jgi:hypothetical protein